MISEYGLTIVVSVYLVYGIGIAGMMIALAYVVAFALRLWMEVRGVYGEYIDFLRHKRFSKVHPGTMPQSSESDETKKALTKRKEDE